MSLNVIGLISGGKDSLYSLAHCVQNGHKIVALANLQPANAKVSSIGKEDEDLNSFMYQTVGYSVIPLYAEALNLPLYKRAISGMAVQKGKDYETAGFQTDQEDETEDMYFLLKEVLTKHPEANAVSAGAILSTYQRTRVESIATRLDLVPLAYLWQYPALPPPSSREDSLTGLLDDMNSAGCDARIIKLASGGIRPSLVFANVASDICKPQLLTGLSRFYAEPDQEFELRGAVLGEGGEYETLALDGPANLWKRRIYTDLEESFEIDGVIYARFAIPRVVDKDYNSRNDIPLPALFDVRFQSILKTNEHRTPTLGQKESLSENIPLPTNILVSSPISRVGNVLQLCNLTAPGNTAAEQFANIVDKLFDSSTLQQIQKFFSDDNNVYHHIANATLLLSSIDVFAEVNQIYSARLWPLNRAIPPARVTVAAFLPPNVYIALSLTLDTSENASIENSNGRDGLHVQSRSYWAPANIGPYSQAVSIPVQLSSPPFRSDGSSVKIKMIQMAGQIPLLPSSMQLFEANFKEQASLALQHLWRVGQERSVDFWLGAGVAYLGTLTYSGEPQASSDIETVLYRAREAAAIWHSAHYLDEKGRGQRSYDNLEDGDDDDEQEDVDVWHVHQNRGLAAKLTVSEHLHKLPNYDLFSVNNGLHGEQALYIPVFIAAEVKELPRNASIEWWSTGISGLRQSTSQKFSEVHNFRRLMYKGFFATGMFIRRSKNIESVESDEISNGEDHNVRSQNREAFTAFWTLLVDMDADERHVTEILSNPAQGLLETLGLENSFSSHEMSASHSFLNLSASTGMQDAITGTKRFKQSVIVPCRHVWTSKHERPTHESFDFPDIQEVALAMILRLDVR